jgi:ribosomal protein L12E/L44/L45/RPP1/RPP2
MELDYSRRVEDARMARMVQHAEGKDFKKAIEGWSKAAGTSGPHKDADDLISALGGKC